MATFFEFTNEYEGLSSAEAEKKLGLYGYNGDGNGGAFTFKASSVIMHPVFIMQIAAVLLTAANGVSQLLSGNNDVGIQGIVTAGVLLLLTIFYAAMEIHKSKKCEQDLHELRRASALKIRAVRNGGLTLLRKEYLVPEDIVLLEAGENVPADLLLLEADGVTIDESVFNSERKRNKKVSRLIESEHLEEEKNNHIVAKEVAINEKDKSGIVYKGCRVISGVLIGKVIATGEDTRVFKLLGDDDDDENEQNQQYDTEFEHVVKKAMPICNSIAIVILVVCALFSFMAVPNSEDFVGMLCAVLLPSIAFSLCFIPPQVASMIRYFYVTGAKRLSEKHTIIKNLSVLEKMNALTCICVEKSGTITKDNLEVSHEYSHSPEMLRNIAVLACRPKPVDPIDKAVILQAMLNNVDVKSLQSNTLIKEYPFDNKHKAMGNLWQVNGAKLLCIKGLPENILPVCNIKDDALYKASKQLASFTQEGCQVIAAAFAEVGENEKIPDNIFEIRYAFIGLVAFENQPRDTIPSAVKECYKAGVRLIMTTGDSKETAKAIGEKVGLQQGDIITGSELHEISKLEFTNKNGEKAGAVPDITNVNIFAGITPEQKLAVVKLLQKNGEIVGLSGDNITDSVILEESDVGIARAGTATGAAYEAADMIMSDNNFNNVVETIKESRQIHRNIKRLISTVLAAHFALIIVGLVMMFSGANVLTPIVVALLSTIIIPTVCLIFNDDNSDLRSDLTSSGFIGKGVMNKKFFILPAVQGALLGAGLVLFSMLSSELGAAQNSAAFLVQFITGLVTMAMVNYSDSSFLQLLRSQKRKSILCTLGVFVLPFVLTYIPFLNSAFGLASLDVFMMFISAAIGFVLQIWYEFVKYKNRHQSKK